MRTHSKFFLSIILGMVYHSVIYCQVQSSQQKLRIFIECNYSNMCNPDYIRNEISITDFVRDPFQADIHIMLINQSTGGAGEKHTLTFIGKKNFALQADTLIFYTNNTATEDEKRIQFVKYLKTGLVQYIIQTSFARYIETTFKPIDSANNNVAAKDKWKSWAFKVGARINLNGDKNYQQHALGTDINASQVKDEYKTSFGFFRHQSRNVYRYEENGEKVELKTRNDFTNITHDYVKSLSPKWSYGYEASYKHSTYDNIQHAYKLSTGIEYNIYPYKLSASKMLLLRYRVNGEKRNYMEETLFGKRKELLLSHDFGVHASYTQNWGSINGSVSWHNYLHDFSKNHISLDLYFEIRIVKGLSVSCYSFAGILKDQLQIAKQGASTQEILLRLKALSTSYNYYTSIGINYRFGSALNNIVNPRFHNN